MVRQKGYKLISPLLRCETPETTKNSNFQNLKSRIQEKVSNASNNRLLDTASIYFRDLDPGNWFAVNQEEKYAPASLFKVPMMMTYFKESQNSPNILSEKVSYHEKTSDVVQSFEPTNSLEDKKSYTIEQIIEQMIQESDNNTGDLLVEHLNNFNTINNTINDIQLEKINQEETGDIMTISQYAYYFRAFYSASYLTDELSEKALNILTKTNFNDGIVSGVPKQILIAHKFGERSFGPNTASELHDCGIIYYPNHPYLLCVMTKGNDFKNLVSVIRSISSTVYESVDKWDKN